MSRWQLPKRRSVLEKITGVSPKHSPYKELGTESNTEITEHTETSDLCMPLSSPRADTTEADTHSISIEEVDSEDEEGGSPSFQHRRSHYWEADCDMLFQVCAKEESRPDVIDKAQFAVLIRRMRPELSYAEVCGYVLYATKGKVR